MKKVLITGKDSYIGRSLLTYLSDDEGFQIHELDVREDQWRSADFSGYDTVFHVAALVHIANPGKDMEPLYQEVNVELPCQLALKAKEAGVSQFIFMSSMSVYGDILGDYRIDAGTEARPDSFYGKSKLEAEKRLQQLASDDFAVCILRPPMVYGPQTKGNYPRLSRLAQKLPVFPKVDNQRSMIFIDHLCDFVRLAVLHQERGIFYPQNRDYVNTSELVWEIRRAHKKQTILLPGFNWLLKGLSKKVGVFSKLFADLTYDQALSGYGEDYQKLSFEETVQQSEK